jgi:SAM-dependent methyltransferase
MRRKILNVGCGTETYGTHFVDFYPSRKDVIKVNLDEEKLPFPNNYFDEVYSRNLLEHLTNPGFAIKEMIRVLKPGGKFIMITDNASYLGWHLSIFGSNVHLGGYEKIQKGCEDRHYALYTIQHLKNLCKKYKLKIIEIKYLDSPARLHVIILRRILSFISSRIAFPRILIIASK